MSPMENKAKLKSFPLNPRFRKEKGAGEMDGCEIQMECFQSEKTILDQVK